MVPFTSIALDHGPMNLRPLRYLIAVAEESSFRRAADRLNMSQPPLSRAIAQLERDLGVSLFFRSKRGVRPTPAGEDLLRRARDLLHRADDFFHDPARTGRGLQQRFRLGFTPTLKYGPTARAISHFVRCRENVALQTVQDHSGQLCSRLNSEEIDLAIVPFPLAADAAALGSERIATAVCGAFLPANHLLAGRASLDLEEIAGETMLFGRLLPGSSYHRQVMTAFATRNLEPRIVTGAYPAELAWSLIAEGGFIAVDAIALLPATFRGVVAVPIRSPRIEVEIGIAWRRGGLSPVARDFIAELRAQWRNGAAP